MQHRQPSLAAGPPLALETYRLIAQQRFAPRLSAEARP